METQCHELEVCFKQEVEMSLRTSQTAIKLLSKLVNMFMQETGMWGAVFVLGVLGVMLFFVYMASRSSTTH
jgi:hypothetical protein